MILPMKKIFLVVQEKYREEAMIQLRETGVMHIENTHAASDGLTQACIHKSWVEDAMHLIEPFIKPKKKETGYQWVADQEEQYEVSNITDLILAMDNDRRLLEGNRMVLLSERERIAAWGNFNSHEIHELAAFFSCSIHLYELPSDYVGKIPEDIIYTKLSDNGLTARVFVLGREIPGKHSFELPDDSLSHIDSELEKIDAQMDAINDRLYTLASHRKILEKEMSETENNIELEAALAELTKVEEVPHELGVLWLKGYVLADDVDKIKSAAAEKGWAFLACDPEPDDETPVKLKNNNVVQLIDPVTNFLELMPGYHETDVSFWFLVFLCVFFGIIFGDAGYGSLLFIGSLVGIARTAKTGASAIPRLLCLFGISNMVWGTLTCVWFGIPVDRLPEFFRNISLSFISPAKTPQVFVDQNLQIFCFSLALVHLSIARVNNIIKAVRKRSLKFLAELGSIAMLLGIFNLILFFVASNKYRSFSIHPVMPYLIGGGVVLNLVFSSWEGNLIKSIRGGLSNIMSIVLAIINMFSDIMSYIRLWAVGLAGSAIAAIVTNMASPMLGNFLVFVGIVVLVFGHGLNIVLSVLSVLIHGIRLIILEFSGHAGVTWSGIAFKPFAKR